MRVSTLLSQVRFLVTRCRGKILAGIVVASVAVLFPDLARASPKEEAKREFELGKSAFGSGDFEEALRRYRRAYELIPLPGLLFNIAQCHRNLGNHRKAINFFRLYLAKVPKASNRAAVETLLVDLEKQARREGRPPDPGQPTVVPGEPMQRDPSGKQRPPVDRADQQSEEPLVLPPTPPPRTHSRPRPFYAKWWFWTAVAVAIGGGVAGIYLAAQSGSALPESRFPVFDVSVE